LFVSVLCISSLRIAMAVRVILLFSNSAAFALATSDLKGEPLPTPPPHTGPLCQLSLKCQHGLQAQKKCLQTYYDGHHTCYQGLKVWQKLLSQRYGCPSFESSSILESKAFCWCGMDAASSELPAVSNATSSHDESEQSELDAVDGAYSSAAKIFARLENSAMHTRGAQSKLDRGMVRKGCHGQCCNDGNALHRIGKNGVAHDMKSCALSTDGSVAHAGSCMQKKTGVSPGCATCFGGSIHCSEKYCIEECACSSWSAPPCHSCMQKYCSAPFQSCSGIPNPGEQSADDFEEELMSV
jgi:hypothetical protein